MKSFPIFPIIIIIFYLLNIFSSKNISENNFVINLIDENMRTGTYVRPILSEKGYLYIISGEDFPENEDKKRYILKYDTISGGLIETKTFYSKYGFWRGEVAVTGDNSENIIITTFDDEKINDRTFEIYGKEKYDIGIFKIYGYRRTLKKIGSYYYYAYLNPDNQKTLIINKIKLIDNYPFYQSLKTTQNNIEFIQYQSMISCDFTEDNNFILCAYFNQNKRFAIAIFNSELQYINNFVFEDCNITVDNFIKIIYFKDNSKFIIIYSLGEHTVRLRFVNLINRYLNNLFYPILNSEYLELNDTLHNVNNGFNDIIKFDSNKIIKIHAFNNEYKSKIILTFFEFHENDAILSIKQYEMFDENPNEDISQPRIAVFKNTLVICVSSYFVQNDKKRTGYFFLNYPMSKDIKLTSNKIIIKDLISLENKIFSLTLGFKILTIPKDFIFKNKLNSLEIKENDILTIDDELELIQYKIRNGSFSLKYEGIAKGDDQGYYSLKIYPNNVNIKNNEILIEGRHGIITIEFNDCLEGYYHLDYDLNLCSNIMPKGYYLHSNDKTFKKCESPCDECNGPKINDTFMNCKTCKENYYITEDTNSCYNEEIDNYFLDYNDTILKRCENCKNENNCLNCIKDNYNDNEELICHENCNECFCTSTDDNNMCCLSCKNEKFFLNDETFNCLLPPNQNEENDLILKQNYNFYIFLIIFIISILLSFIIFITSFFYKKENNKKDNENDNNEDNDNDNQNYDNIKKVEMEIKNKDENTENIHSIN